MLKSLEAQVIRYRPPSPGIECLSSIHICDIIVDISAHTKA